MQETQSSTSGKGKCGSGLLLVVLLGLALSLLCNQAYQSHWVMWANDSQLGALKSSSAKMPDTFFGNWLHHWWIGMAMPANSPSLSLLLATVVSPEMFLKIFTPLTMLWLGFCAWVLFRQLKFSPIVSVLGGLAAGLNMHCFSNACWGLGTWNVSIAMIFLAVAALVTDAIRQIWVKAILAGLAVGLSVMEGFDSGAILSVYFGVFVLFFCWITESTVAKGIAKGLVSSALVVFFAILIAASTLYTLVGTQVTGITGGGDSAKEKAANWPFATQWSLPKLETLKVVLPGIFGYRMDEFSTPPDPLTVSLAKVGGWPKEFVEDLQDKSSAYWGRVGEDPHLTAAADLESDDPKERVAAISAFTDQTNIINVFRGDNVEIRTKIVSQIKPQVQGAQRRHSGNGEYAGIVTALFALMALAQSFRGKLSPYSLFERRMVWFWALASLFSLMAAWGRFSFLYALLYQLPGVSAIRNPIKFMHPFVITWVILAGFGMEAFYRCYLKRTIEPSPATKALKGGGWWRKTGFFDKVLLGSLIILVFGFFEAYGKYAAYKDGLIAYLGDHGFPPDAAARIAAFSVNEARWTLLFFTAAAAVVMSAVALVWAKRWTWVPWAVLCGIVIFDMARADLPWVRYYNYDHKYSMNDVTKILMDKPYEHRVSGRSNPRGGYDIEGDANFGAVIHWWIENDFPYHDIESLEIDQMPRTPVLDFAYLGAFPYDQNSALASAARMWKLTNTRYVLANPKLLPTLNQVGDPLHHSFRYAEVFNLVAKPGYTLRGEPGLTLVADAGDMTPQKSDQGTCALIEYGDALPRAKLYANWTTPTNNDQTLQMLTSQSWDPASSVLIAYDTPVPVAPTNSTADPGTVNISSWDPKDIKLDATANSPAVLLYNDRTATDWHVWVDGKESPLLRCNYIMRGVFLTAGQHRVEFRYLPSTTAFWVTVSAWLVGFALLGYLVWCRFSAKAPPGASSP